MIITTEQDKILLKESIKNKSVSYSQMAIYLSCPLKYKLKYIDKIELDKPNINLLFGSAFHATLQHFIKICYTVSAKAACELPFDELLFTYMQEEFKTLCEKQGNNKFTTADEMKLYYNQGLEILENIAEQRSVLYPIKSHKLIGIEVPICIKLPNIDVTFLGYIDYVLEDERDNTHYVTDIKTSNNGWYDREKKDELKQLQLLIYKKFYSEQYNVDIEKINPEFLVVKRKQFIGIDKSDLFPNQLRKYQQIPVTSGKVKMNKANTQLSSFISIFNTDGSIKQDITFNSCKNEYNCKWCPYNGTEYCR